MSLLSALFSPIANADVPWLLLADVVGKATLLLGLAGLATLVLRRASAAIRHLVWTLALAGSLVVPALSSTLPRWELPLVTIAPQTAPVMLRSDAIAPPLKVSSEAARSDVRAVPERLAGAEARPRLTSPAGPSAGLTTARWEAAAVGLWLAGFLAIVGRLALGLLAVQWMSRNTEVVSDASWLPLARRLAADLGVSPRVRFLRSRATTMPMAWGILRPAVLMPADADGWPLERLRIVLLHELAHVRRRDCLTHVLAQAACAVYWFNPLAWMAARHARAERERACDDLVLTSGTRGPDYAQELLHMARALRPGRFPAVLAGATLAMAHRSQLEGRLMAILDPAVPRTGLTRLRAVAASLACACAITPLAAVQPWAAATAIAAPEAAAVRDLATLDLPVPSPEQAPRVDQPSPSPTPPSVRTPEAGAGDARATDDARTATVPTVSATAAVSATVAAAAALTDAIGATLANLTDLQAMPTPTPTPAPNPQPSPGAPSSQGGRVDPRTIAALTLALKDTDRDVRATALHALVRMRDPSVLEPLVQALRDESADVREQAAVGLGQLRDKRAVDPLIAAMKDSSADVREHAVVALGQLRDPRASDAMILALKDTSPDVREHAAYALGQLRDRRATAALTGVLTDVDDDVREKAVFALGQLRDPAAIDGLATALRDARPDVRQQAVFALGQIRDRRAVDPLVAALKDAIADVRQQAAFALGQIRDARAVEALVFTLKDADADVREQAAFALGQIRDPRAIDGLTTALKDANPGVRKQAAFALGQLAG